jgi:hypothetical protein
LLLLHLKWPEVLLLLLLLQMLDTHITPATCMLLHARWL